MGNGKGNRSTGWPRSSQQVLYEINGVPEALAREAFTLASAKLPLKCNVRRSRSAPEEQDHESI